VTLGRNGLCFLVRTRRAVDDGPKRWDSHEDPDNFDLRALHSCASLEISVGSVEFHIFPLYMSIYIVASILQIRQ